MNPDLKIWIDDVNSATQAQNTILLTRGECEAKFSELISSSRSPLSAARLKFDPSTHNTFKIEINDGAGAITDPTVSLEVSIQGPGKCRLEAWFKAQATEEERDAVIKAISCFAEAFWHGNVRDQKSELVALDRAEGKDLVYSTVRNAASAYGVVSCLFCDLDRFKQVNDRLGMDKGDEVILTFAKVLSDVVADDALAIHRSGDEFVILFPGGGADQSLELGMRIVNQVKSYDFDTGDVEVGVSAGIAVVERDTLPETYEKLEQLAEKTVKIEGGGKLRGRANLMSERMTPEYPRSTNIARNRAICVLKGNPSRSAPFESPWLNVFATRVYQEVKPDFDWTEIPSRLQSLLEEFQFSIVEGITRSAVFERQGLDGRPDVSPLDISFAAANGIFRAGLAANENQVAGKRIVVQHDVDNASFSCLQLQPNDVTLLTVGTKREPTETIDLGGFRYFNSSDDVADNEPSLAQRVLLLKIGHIKLQLPVDLFAEVLVVDDRPTRGGQLPDFWESVLARLVSLMSRNPNVEKVYVLGNREYARETVKRLSAVDRWKDEAEHLSYKTGAKQSEIVEVSRRLVSRIVFVDNEEGLLSNLAEDLRNESTFPPLRPVSPNFSDQRFLKRQLELGPIALGQSDGCRVGTIAEAFPFVIEIARKIDSREQIMDQAGQELGELMDFKVHLKTPLLNRVPAFYSREEASLKEYANRAFRDTDSLFGSKLRQNGQLDTVINHIRQAISGDPVQFATRRAILVVPYATGSQSEFSPLGLVSIRIVPRYMQQRTLLHYSFTWRTVEALVGFPYSIYGSVCYSEHLTSMICEGLDSSITRQIEIGQLSYIAHSLHIFQDDYGQKIARRIVDDASL